MELMGHSSNPISSSLIYLVFMCLNGVFSGIKGIIQASDEFSRGKEKKKCLLSLPVYMEASSYRNHECCSDMVRLPRAGRGPLGQVEMHNGPEMRQLVVALQSVKWS